MNMFCRLSKHRRTCNFCWRSICVRVHYHYPTFLKYLMSPMRNNMNLFTLFYIFYSISRLTITFESAHVPIPTLSSARSDRCMQFRSAFVSFFIYVSSLFNLLSSIWLCACAYCGSSMKRQRLIKILVADVVCDTIFNKHDNESPMHYTQFEVHKAHQTVVQSPATSRRIIISSIDELSRLLCKCVMFRRNTHNSTHATPISKQNKTLLIRLSSGLNRANLLH